MRDDDTAPLSASAQIWAEVSELMRLLRTKAELPLREAERRTEWGRGTLSQVETGRSRPTRAQVEWYDDEFGADGLLVTLFAEARGAHGPTARAARPPARQTPGDAFELVEHLALLGQVVPPASTIQAGWVVRNAGTVPWSGRRLRRIGAPMARGLIASAPSVPVPDCAPGDTVRVEASVVLPDCLATFAAYWEVVDEAARPCYTSSQLVCVTLVTHAAAAG